jgi:hypothetical protein
MKQKRSRQVKEEYINPFRKKEIKYWADKWKVQMQLIKEAMGVTGSARVATIKNLLSRFNYIKS